MSKSMEKLGAGSADRAIETLRAASLTEEGRELLKQGRLTEELEPPGFEALAGMVQGRRQSVLSRRRRTSARRSSCRPATA